MEKRNIGGTVVIQGGFREESYKTIPGHSCLPFSGGIGDHKKGWEVILLAQASYGGLVSYDN